MIGEEFPVQTGAILRLGAHLIATWRRDIIAVGDESKEGLFRG